MDDTEKWELERQIQKLKREKTELKNQIEELEQKTKRLQRELLPQNMFRNCPHCNIQLPVA